MMPCMQHTYTLSFYNAELERNFRGWYHGVHLPPIDFWGIIFDVILHIFVWINEDRRHALGHGFDAAFLLAVLHLYAIIAHRDWHARHRRGLAAVRRALVTYVCCHSCGSLLIPASKPLHVVRNFVGSTGAAFLTVLQMQFREQFLVNALYNVITMACFMAYTSATDICQHTLSYNSRIRQGIANVAAGLDHLTATITAAPVNLTTAKRSVQTVDRMCVPLVRAAQVVLMACCANLLVYLLEQRARASFITDLICAAQQQQQGQHVQGRQAGPWAGASEEVRQLQLMRRQLRDSLSWRSMVFWLVLLTLASATTWQLACLVYSL